MSRTADERIASLAKRVQDSDPSVEYDKGPVFDLMIRPVGEELGSAEDKADYISNLYTSAFSDVADEREVLALETNFAMENQGSGKSSRNKAQYFYRFARPQVGESFMITEGTLVANSDNSMIFKSLETLTMDGQYADTYYNSQEGWYGIPVLCEATAIGSAYDLKQGRVNKILSVVDGWDGTINLADYAGGEEAESLSQKTARIKKRFEGMDTGTIGGLESRVLNYNPAVISSVRLIDPSNPNVFKRPTIRPALDLYIIGQDMMVETDTFNAVADQTSYVMINQPVYSITSVSRNGTAVTDWQFERDVSVLQQSSRSQDRIVFNAPLSLGDAVSITYQYNGIIQSVQNDLFPSTNNLLFRTDVLIREAREALLSISIRFSFVGSVSLEDGEADLIAALYRLVEVGVFIDNINPETLRSQLKSEVVGLGELFFVKFTKTVGSLSDVEIVNFEDNEYPKIDETNLIISPMR
jgi:hypothetical protein